MNFDDKIIFHPKAAISSKINIDELSYTEQYTCMLQYVVQYGYI